MKRTISILLLIAIVISLACNVAAVVSQVDSFEFADGVSISEWESVGNSNGSRSIVDGELRLSNTTSYTECGVINDEEIYDDFTAEFTYRFVAGANNDGALFLYRAASDASTGYAVYFVHCPDDARQYYIKFTSRPYNELLGGMFFNNKGLGVVYDSDVQVKVVVSGATHSLYVTMPGEEYGDPVYTYTEEAPLYSEGHIGFMLWHDSGTHQVTTAFDDLKITVEKEKEVTFGFDSYSLSLAEGISVNFAADATLFDEMGYTNPVATFTIKNHSVTAEGVENGNGKYIFKLKNIRPDWMGEAITATITATLNGEPVISEPMTHSASEYCYTVLRGTDCSATLKTLLVDLLNYGATAQEYTGHNGTPVNSELTVAEQACGTSGNPVCSSDKSLDMEDCTTESATWTGMALYLRETIRLRGSFTTTQVEGLSVKITDFNGNFLTTIAQRDMTYTDGKYVFFYDGLMATQMRMPVKMTICRDNVAISKTLTYSVQSYANKVIDGGADVKLANLMNAMIQYGDAAVAYTNNPFDSTSDTIVSDSWGNAVVKTELIDGVRYDKLSSTTSSVLESQVGYSQYGYKAVYIRSTQNPGSGAYYADFSVISATTGQTVYTGKAAYWGELWESYWWVADFSDFQTEGQYYIKIANRLFGLKSQSFTIAKSVLTDASLQMVLFDQLDARRTEGKLGWRDSSTDGLREIHAQTITLETLCDVYDHMYSSLSATNKEKLLDNIKFGCEYLLALQEKTSDPLTNGRFKHDLYESEFSATKIRNFYDTVTAMSALARCYGIMKNHDSVVAQTYKEAFELSYALCVLRPYYLESEFTLETEMGRDYTSAAARTFYDISSMSWKFPTTLRTRDRLMFMRACTTMYKSTGEAAYMTQATILADQIADRQYTDYQSTIDGCYGMFKEFDNSESAFMIDWLQGFGQNLGCIQPTDLQPFMDLINYDPQSAEAARWYNVIHTFTEGYVKNSSDLTALGIYPVAAYSNKTNGGVKFFQSISHGANNLYGQMGRNMTILGAFLQDAQLQELAQRNVQFIVGLNPGIPNAYNETKWTATSFVYGIGKNYYKPSSFYEEMTPLGSVVNGFSAACQFSEDTISQNPDLPRGILNPDGTSQFNEDYLPHAMGYLSAAMLTETPYCITVKTLSAGNPVTARIDAMVDGEVIKTYTTPSSGELKISDLPLGETVTLVVADANGTTTKRMIGVVGGGSDIWTVDFASLVRIQLYAPNVVEEQERAGAVVLQNLGSDAVTVKLQLLADGVILDEKNFIVEIASGESVTIPVQILSAGEVKPYVLIAYADHDIYTTTVSLEGLAK